jgi:small subunit ribosomal protein S17
MNTPTPADAKAAEPRARKTPRAATTRTAKSKQPAAEAQAATSGAAASTGRPPGRRQQKIGRVTSDKMQKTIVVAVESLKRHPIYKKTYKYTTKFKAHDERNDARIGDMVRIEETRPLSREKRWRLVEILKRAEQTVAPEIVEQRLEQAAGLDSAGVGGEVER